MSFISQHDSEVGKSIEQEFVRQRRNIELIASENCVSEAVMLAQGTILTNKYAEGYPGRRYYGGCEEVDATETLAIETCKKTFRRKFRQCSTAFRSFGKSGSIYGIMPARRYYTRYEP